MTLVFKKIDNFIKKDSVNHCLLIALRLKLTC